MGAEKGERRIGSLFAGGALLLLALAHAVRAAGAGADDMVHLSNVLVLLILGPLSVLLIAVGLPRRSAPRK